MQRDLLVLGVLGTGAGLMLLLDPGRAIGSTSRTLRHRVLGATARLGPLGSFDAVTLSDSLLRDRVRARLGHVVSYPGAIDVATEGGRVVLTGAVPASERRAVISAVARVPGVECVDDCLDESADLDDLRLLDRPDDVQISSRAGRWRPRLRLIAGVLTGGLAVYGAARAAR